MSSLHQAPLLTAFLLWDEVHLLETGFVLSKASIRSMPEAMQHPSPRRTPELAMSCAFLQRESSLAIIKYPVQSPRGLRKPGWVFCGGGCGATPATHSLDRCLALLLKSCAWGIVFPRGHNAVPYNTLGETDVKYFGSRNNHNFLMSVASPLRKRTSF